MAHARSTKSIPKKLQMKPGRTVMLVNTPPGYDKLLGKLPSGAELCQDSSSSQEFDVVQVFVDSRAQLEKRLPRLKSSIKPTGMIWVSFPKGTSSKKGDINRDSIAAYAKQIGLEGVAIVSIDDDWSALRLKIDG